MLDLSLGSNLYTNDIWEAALQELDIIFETENTELIGYPEFGTNFMQFLWTLTPMTADLQHYIEEKLMSTCFVSKFRRNIQINIEEDTEKCDRLYLVKITLYNDYHAVEKTYNLKTT